MKKLFVASFALVSIVAFPATSLAECSGNDCKNVTVDRFEAYHSGLILDTSGDEKKLDCAERVDFILIQDTDSNYDSIFTLLSNE